MSEENEKTSLMDKYIKLRLGGATYRVRLLTLLLFAAAAIILIAAILILAFSGSCAKSKAHAATAPTATATIEATAEPTPEPTPEATPEEVTPTDEPENTEPTATPETTPASDFKTLKTGATNDGDTVKKVQQRLVELHYMPYPEKDSDGKGVVTTTYGSMCAKAITKFQERNGLKQSGQSDKTTYDKLMSDKATAYTMKKDDKLDIVRTIQEALVKKGYLKGKADGVCGEKTIDAVKAFQKANNLTADGQAGTKTLQLLLGY